MRQNLVVQQLLVAQAEHTIVTMGIRTEQSLLDCKPCTPCRPANLHACRTCAWSCIHSTSVQQQEEHRCQKQLVAAEFAVPKHDAQARACTIHSRSASLVSHVTCRGWLQSSTRF
jgi:hypothetical protein